MTDTPAPTPTSTATPAERVHVTADAASRPAVAPIVYLAGLVVLAVAVFFLWRYPTTPRRLADDSNRLAALQSQVESLTERLGKLETRPVADTGPLDARVAKLEQRTGPDLAPIEARIARLEARPVAPPVDLSGINARIDALARDDAAAGAKRDGALAALAGKLDSTTGELGQRIAGVDSHVAVVEREQKDVTGVATRAARTARVQAATAALDAGQPLGTIPDSPAPLARFATAAPPTTAGLRLSFADAAEAARRASQPAITGDRSFLSRAWLTAEQAVTVRQGDRVMVGDPIAGVLAHAKDLLDAGDLAGSVRILGQLQGPARAAMADWIGQAQALLDARSALGTLAAQG